MPKVFLGIVLAVAAILGALWWWLYRPQTQALDLARADNGRLQLAVVGYEGQVRSLEGQVADLQSVRAELQKASVELQQKVQEKETELSSLRGAQDELVSGLKSEIESNQVQVQRFRDQLRVDLVDEVLFDSGEAEVKPAGKAVLQKVGDILKKTEGRKIEVQGHTDNTGARRVNMRLSKARAEAVEKFLEANGVSPSQLTAKGYGPDKPIASNKTKDGRAQNRRVELVQVQ